MDDHSRLSSGVFCPACGQETLPDDLGRCLWHQPPLPIPGLAQPAASLRDRRDLAAARALWQARDARNARR